MVKDAMEEESADSTSDDESSGEEDFREAISDVAPLTGSHQQKVPPVRERKEATAAQLNRRESALGNKRLKESDLNPLTLGEVPQLQPRAVLAWKKDGVQHEVFQRLRNGKYPIEGSLDMHRMTVKEARTEMLRFFALARANQWRTLLIAHGRGEKSQTPARLKSYVAFWLGQVPDIIAFHSADQRHGGTGAVFVLLKKMPKAKEETREKFGLKTGIMNDNDRC